MPSHESGSPGALRRVLAGVFGGALGQGINIGSRLVIVPMFIWAWGESLYGEWLSLYAAVAYLTVLDLGIQTYAVNRLTQLHAEAKMDEYNRVLHSALGLYTRLALLVFAVVGATVLLAPLSAWFNFTHMGPGTTSVLALLLATVFIVQLPNGAILGAYRSCGEYPTYTLLGALSWLVIWTATGLTLLAKPSPPYVALVQVIPIVLTSLFALWDVPRRHPGIKFGFALYDKKLARSMLYPGLLFFVIQASQTLVVQGSTMIVAAQVGPRAVAMFSVIRMVPMVLRQGVSTLTYAAWPELTALEARREYAVLRRNHLTLVKLSFALCATAAIFLHFAGPELVPRWTLGKIGFDQRLLDILLGYVVSQTVWMVSAAFPSAFNKHRWLALMNALNAAVGIAAGLILGRKYGVVGVALGIWVGDLIFGTLIVPGHTCRLLQANLTQFWVQTVVRGAPLLLAQFYACLWISRAGGHWALGLLAIGAVSLAGALLGGYFLWLSSDERALVSTLFGRILARLRRASPPVKRSKDTP